MSDVTELKIFPQKKPSNGLMARAEAVLDDGIIIKNIQIREGKQGVFCRFPGFMTFKSDEIRRAVTNRILATWVVNHCMDDYSA